MAEPKQVFLHIGAPKTGTTYLQRVLHSNRATLAESGVLYPRIGGEAQHVAVWDLRGTFADAPPGKKFAGRWDDLVRETLGWSGHTVVISSEMFVFSRAAMARQILRSFPDAEVHVVYTARDLARQIPAVWQEQVKNQRVMRYDRFLDDVLGKRRTGFAKHFWSAQDAADALRRWSADLDPRHVHLVTAPPSGAPAGLLWERFAQVVGLQGVEVSTDIPAANPSLSVTAAELVRRYNQRHGREIPILRFRRLMKRRLLPALTTAIADRDKLPLGKDQRARIGRLSDEMVRDLDRAGYDVVGSLQDLVPDLSGAPAGRGPDDLSDSEVIDALLDVVDHLLRAGGRRGGSAPQVKGPQ